MQKVEWNTQDKSGWQRGEWDQEPDKAQWTDEATGMPCLLVRNHSGALCGYVGISAGHPLYGVDYSDTAKLPKHTLAEMLNARGVGDLYADDLENGEIRVESILDAHGGITFANFCGDHSRAAWERFRARKPEWEIEAKKYPVGDSAQRLKEWAGTFDDYEAWVTRAQAAGICHVPERGEPERVWWLGFDCSHAGDHSPAYESRYSRLGEPTGWGTTVEYRNVDYVKRHCASLAQQLAAIRSATVQT